MIMLHPHTHNITIIPFLDHNHSKFSEKKNKLAVAVSYKQLGKCIKKNGRNNDCANMDEHQKNMIP